MDIIEELRIGDRIEIEYIRAKKKSISEPMVSQIVDKRNEKLYVSNPIRRGLSSQLILGQQIIIIFFREEKGVFYFSAEVVEIPDIKPVMYGVKPTGPPQRLQRRLYYRLKILTKIIIRDLNRSWETEGLTNDISGGGLSANINRFLRRGQKVECVIFLDEKKSVTTVSEIVRIEKIAQTKEYTITIKYIDITDNNRKEIIGFIFKKQQEFRQKGLI